MKPRFDGWITACVAHYKCQRYVHRAVASLLSQTYPWIRVIVINDGDPCPPWRELGSIRDPRLVRFSLPKNGGCFFCWEVARRATHDPFFMMQDADDWAAPNRAEALLESLLSKKSDLAVSAQPQFCERSDGTPYQTSVRWNQMVQEETNKPFVVQRALSEEFRYRAPHHGLIRTSALREIGGYYGGFRIGWDTLLTNLVLMVGSISWTPEQLYFRLVRPDSLTHSVHTGAQSEYAAGVSRCLRMIYQECFAHYQTYRRMQINRAQLSDRIQSICGRHLSADDKAALNLQSGKLRGAMG
jgi:glycosyltransferase involved in cell wall biosynthesis